MRMKNQLLSITCCALMALLLISCGGQTTETTTQETAEEETTTEETTVQPIESPRKQAEGEIGGVKVSLDYGSPGVKGRKILGGREGYLWWKFALDPSHKSLFGCDILGFIVIIHHR